MAEPDTKLFKYLRVYCKVSAMTAVTVGFLVLCGWTLHVELLKSALPGLVAMKVNTAIGLMLSGASLWLLLPGRSHARTRYVAAFLALVVTVIGAAALGEYLFSVNLGIDELFFTEPSGAVATYSPGRMAPTSAAFLALGLALLLLDWKSRRGYRPAQALSLLAGLTALIAITGYIYNAPALYRILLYTQVALHTAIAIFLLSVGVFFARPRIGIAGDLTGQGSGSVMARRFLPAIFFVPIVLGWIRMQGQLAGMYGWELGLALYATANIIVFAVLLWLSARLMNKEYEQRNGAEVEIRVLNAQLEARVTERTKILEQQSAALTEQAALLDLAHDAIIVRDMSGRILFWNRGAETLYGWTPSLAVGKIFFELLKTELPQPLKEIEVQLLQYGHWEGQEISYKRDGNRLTVASRWALQRDPAGCPVQVLSINNDITARKVSEEHLARIEEKRRFVEEALRKSEEGYRLLLDGIQDYAIFMMDPQGQVVSWNAGAERIKGYRADQIVGQNFSRFFPLEDIERGRPQEVLRITAANGRHEEQGMRVRKDGSRFLASVTFTALRDSSDNLCGFSEFSHDLTESKESRAKYRGLLEAAPDAMVVVDQCGEIVLLNVQAEKQFGYRRDELVGQKVKNIIPEGFAERLVADGTRTAAEALAQQIGTGIELTGRRKDASNFPIEIMLSPLESAEGTLVTAAIRDISLRKAGEVHLGQMEGRYRGLLEAAPDAMVVVNESGEIVLLNVQAEKQFGYRRDELLGQKVKNIIPEGFAERLLADGTRTAAEALAQQIGTGIELTGRRKDGSNFPIEIMLSPLESAEGTLVTAAIRNISLRKKSEAHIQELNRSNEELGQFAYVASHDLQEPLRMVASYTQLLSKRYKGKLDSDADEFIAFAVDGASRMQRLIQDLLTYSRVATRGNDLLHTSSEEALQRALTNLRGAIEDSGAVVTHDSLPPVLADEMQLIQLFQNLVGNAIKYQRPGVPQIHVSVARNVEKKWVFSVRDNGLGIDSQYFEKIFVIFQRLHKREEYAGTGIGLAICKKIVERHGGSISVESQPGQGSTFRFALAGSEIES